MSSDELKQKVPREQQKDLHLLTMSTPNGQKIQIALEECKALYGTDFSFELINIMSNAQKEPWYLKLNPNGRIPTLVDNKVDNGSPEPFAVMESGAILLYLAKKVDKDNAFGFSDDLERSECIQWLFWMNAGLGPMQGQFNHFNKFAKEKIPYAIKRYHDETFRLLDVLEIQLSGRYSGVKKEYLAGKGSGKYSWADISTFPWANIAGFSGIEDEEMAKLPNVTAWLARIKARPAVEIGTGEKYKKQ